ncbi:helix-turn-helix transcriptional regulator [Mesorhizobium sp. ANAO-SY3R2]|uniref:helix-turn-helix transcriptional regulator n=1 Tax=Mesorhizobium sp. ANAO-SY3R2 TaxID=3166644 RepID=UPI00366F7EF5
MTSAQARQHAETTIAQEDTRLTSQVRGTTAHAVTLADAVKRCRWLAVDLGARDFALCLAGSGTDSSRLVPCFDSDYPGNLAAARLLDGGIGEHLMRHIRQSTAPCWWADDAAAETAFSALTWTSRIKSPASNDRGIAFPVYTDRGQAGLIVFGGPELAPNAASLHDLHGRCFALFDAVARFGIGRTDELPAMSRRELECLKLTSRGHTSEEIAKLLKLSVHTANQYLTQTTQKLNAVNRMHAVAKALRLGLID